MANGNNGNGEDAKKKKQKRPTALKRDIQNARKRAHHRSLKSTTRTAITRYETAVKASPETATKLLSSIYSLMDKGVKKGLFKKNKAARVKSTLTQKLQAK